MPVLCSDERAYVFRSNIDRFENLTTVQRDSEGLQTSLAQTVARLVGLTMPFIAFGTGECHG